MSRQDPGAADGNPNYPVEPPCVCGCAAGLHGYGVSAGRDVHKSCSSSYCDCRLYRPAPAPLPDRCPTCSAHWDAIEAARVRGAS